MGDRDKSCVHLVSYADDSHGYKRGRYVETRDRMVELLKNLFPEIEYVHSFGVEELLKSRLYENYPKLFDSQYVVRGNNKRQFGCYVYKISIISQILRKEVEYDDFVLYHDSSPGIWKPHFRTLTKRRYRLDSHLNKCRENGGILLWSSPRRASVDVLTSPTVLEDLGAIHLAKTRQACTSWIIVQKTERTMGFIQRVLDYMVTDKFIESHGKDDCNGGDQVIVDLFLKMEGMDNFVKGNGKCILDSFPKFWFRELQIIGS